MGHTVLKKTKGVSCKSKKRLNVSEDERLIFKNIHEAILDEETWNLADKTKKCKKRTTYAEDPFNVTGILVCVDCGAKLIRHDTQPKNREKMNSDRGYSCSSYRSRFHNCTMHFVKRSDMLELIKVAIQRACKYTITNEQEFREQIVSELSAKQEIDYSENDEKLAEAQNQMKELEHLIDKLYETYANEKISVRQYDRLMAQYNSEYDELDALTQELEPVKDEFNPNDATDSFIALAKKYADFEELTPIMIHEFIDLKMNKKGI